MRTNGTTEPRLTFSVNNMIYMHENTSSRARNNITGGARHLCSGANGVGAVLAEMREWYKLTAHQHRTKNFLEAELYTHIKTRAAGRAKTAQEGGGTCAGFGGALQRDGGSRGGAWI